jgi:inosine-uridine nucleoside N-ribohydrolase
MSPAARKIIIDTDPGVGIPGTDADDGIALLLALADPRLDLVAVTTTFGNCPPALSARGAAAILEAAGRTDIPIGVGSPTALDGRLHPLLVEAYRGPRGREGRIPLPPAAGGGRDASDLIIETVRAHPGEVVIVAIGPQTNLALALLREPALADELHSIVFMGGGLGLQPEFGRGNVTAVAECNMYFDPAAADIVFRSGVPLTMIGLDVTNPATGTVLGEADVRTIDRDRSAASALLADICATYLDAPMFDWGHGCVLYDPLAVLAAADPELGRYETLSLRVETRGEFTSGQTVPVAQGGSPVRVMVDVDGDAAVQQMLRLLRTL